MSVIRQLNKILYSLLLYSVPLFSHAAGDKPIDDSLRSFSNNKEIPAEYEKPILTALSYFPELKDVHIIFRVKKAYTPLTTKPNLAGVFKAKDHRTYLITISNETVDTLKRLLYKNLTFEEQVGIMGHELSHVVDFNSKNFPQKVAKGFGHLSKQYLDRMEFKTDGICIDHGLGQNLLAYSEHVREVMHVHNWRGVDFVHEKVQSHERYMNPATIEKYMSEAPTH